jgi:hypothetical protein
LITGSKVELPESVVDELLKWDGWVMMRRLYIVEAVMGVGVECRDL